MTIPFLDIAHGPSPVAIPEGACGDFRVVHGGPEAKLPLIHGGRVEVSGFPETWIEFDPPRRFIVLKQKDVAWTSSIPHELWSQWFLIHDFRGEVLLTGLGLGMAAVMLARKPEVTRVVVIEKAPEVIALVAPHLVSAKIEVRHGDAIDFVRATEERFDFAYHDFWADTSRYHYRLLRDLRRWTPRILRDGDPLKVRLWAEDDIITSRAYALNWERYWRRSVRKERQVRYVFTRERLVEIAAEWDRQLAALSEEDRQKAQRATPEKWANRVLSIHHDLPCRARPDPSVVLARMENAVGVAAGPGDASALPLLAGATA